MITNLKLKNLTTGAEITLDEKTLYGYILDGNKTDFDTVSSGRQTVKAIGQIGSTVASISLEGREPTITGWVTGPDVPTLQKRKALLNRLVNPLHRIQVSCYNDKYVISGVPLTSVAYAVPYSENNEIFCKFVINLTCENPCFERVEGNQLDIAIWKPNFHFPLIIPKNPASQEVIFAFRSESLIGVIDNDGVADIGGIFIFSATGTVDNPYILNLETQEILKCNLTMGTGDILTINTITGQIAATLYDSSQDTERNAYNNIDFPTSDFIQLYRGINRLRYGSDDDTTALNVTIKYHPQYLEVQ